MLRYYRTTVGLINNEIKIINFDCHIRRGDIEKNMEDRLIPSIYGQNYFLFRCTYSSSSEFMLDFKGN